VYAGSAFKAFVVMAPPKDYVSVAKRIGCERKKSIAARQFVQSVAHAIAQIEYEEHCRASYSSASNESVEL